MNTLNACCHRNPEARARRVVAALAASALVWGVGPGRAQTPAVDDLPEKPAYVEMLRGDQQRDRGDRDKAAGHYAGAIAHFEALLGEQPDYKSETLRFRMEYCRRQLALLRGDAPAGPVPTPRAPAPAPAPAPKPVQPEPAPAAPVVPAELQELRVERDRLQTENAALVEREAAALEEVRRQTAQMQQAMDLLRADLDRREQEAAAERQAREALTGEAATFEQTRASLAAELAALAAERDAGAKARDALEGDLRRVTGQHDRLRDDLARAGERLVEAEARDRELTERMRTAEARAREVERERDELRAAAARVAEAEPAAPDLDGELRAALLRAEEAEAARTDALARLADLERQMAGVEAERQALAQRLSALEREPAVAAVDPKEPAAPVEEIEETAGASLMEQLREAAAKRRRSAMRSLAARITADEDVPVEQVREAGRLLLQAGETNGAHSLLLGAVGRAPDHVGALEDLAQAAYRLGRAEEAIGYYERVLTIEPGRGRAHFNLAVLRATTRPPQLDAARRHYETAQSLGEPRDETLERQLAR